MAERTQKDAVPTLIDFQRLMNDLLNGACRSHFRSWEIDLLLDIEESLGMIQVPSEKVLRDYRAAVEDSWEDGGTGPTKFSEYLASQIEQKPIQSASVHPKKRSA